MVKRLFIGLAILVVLLIAVIAFQWFGPAPGIVVSPQTTYITESLGPDGLPNFAQAILDQQREGVTQENNAAVLFWQAMGPGDEISPMDFALVAGEIGLEYVDESRTLIRVYDDSVTEALIEWIHEQRGTKPEAEADEPGSSGYGGDERHPEIVAQNFIEHATQSPWTADDIPPLARWVADNNQPLDLLVKAAARPRWHSPSPSMLRTQADSLIATLLSAVQEMRSAARALSARAMFHVGAGDYNAAWQDTLATWRLGEHAASGWTLVEKLVGIALRSVAQRNTLALLEQPDLPVEIGEQILTDLQALKTRIDMAEAMNFGERLAFIDIVIGLATGRDGGLVTNATNSPGIAAILQRAAFDPNVVLPRVNEIYDLLAAAASEENYARRSQALSAFEKEVDKISAQAVRPGSVLGAMVSRRRRSELIGEVLIGLMVPAVSAASEAADRDESAMTLTRTAAALAIYRAQHGEYPESLIALTPEILPAASIDLFTDNPLIYQRRDEGYLLYSVWKNGADDGGNDFGQPIVDGEWVDESSDDFTRPSGDQADQVVRLPLPPPQFPEIQVPEPQPTLDQAPETPATDQQTPEPDSAQSNQSNAQ